MGTFLKHKHFLASKDCTKVRNMYWWIELCTFCEVGAVSSNGENRIIFLNWEVCDKGLTLIKYSNKGTRIESRLNQEKFSAFRIYDLRTEIQTRNFLTNHITVEACGTKCVTKCWLNPRVSQGKADKHISQKVWKKCGLNVSDPWSTKQFVWEKAKTTH